MPNMERPAQRANAARAEKNTTADNTMMPRPAFQVMPTLSAEEYVALRDDIAERGIVVPVVVDQDGRLLGGHHRRRAAAELGISCPEEVHKVVDDEDARQTALALNLAPRHLTREQRRELIASEITARPDDSDRMIARRFSCSPSTVGAVRRSVSKLDTPENHVDGDREKCEQITESIRCHFADVVRDTEACIASGTHPAVLLAGYTEMLYEACQGADQEIADALRAVFKPLLDDLRTLAWGSPGGWRGDHRD